MGKPSKGTPKDMRLRENKRPAVKGMPARKK